MRTETLTTLMTFVLIRIVQTIVVSVAYVYPRNAVAVIAREQIAEARSTFGLAVAGRFVAPVQAIVVSVAVPSSWNAPVTDKTPLS